MLRRSQFQADCPVLVASLFRPACSLLFVFLLADYCVYSLASRVRQSVSRNPFPTKLRTTHCVTF